MNKFDIAYSRLMEENESDMQPFDGQSGYVEIKHPNGKIDTSAWYENKQLHRVGGPAIIWYDKNGIKYRQFWYDHNRIHREDGPAEETFYPSGKIRSRGWVIRNRHHRLDGPAQEMYDEDGNITSKWWFVNGVKYTEEEFNKEYDPSTPIAKRRLKSDLGDVF